MGRSELRDEKSLSLLVAVREGFLASARALGMTALGVFAQAFRFSEKSLVERLQFYDGGAVVVPHPESDGRCGIIHEHSSDVRRAWEEIVSHLT
jgi:hypothetical protein